MSEKKRCCKKKQDKVVMPNRMEIKRCDKVYPPHPCDPAVPCNPCKNDDGECKPALCLENIKNPALPGEITRCKPGAFLKVAVCNNPEPPHPCDPQVCIPGFRKKIKCPPVAICYDRIKNPEKKKEIKCPNESYEAYLPKEVPCVPPKPSPPCP